MDYLLINLKIKANNKGKPLVIKINLIMGIKTSVRLTLEMVPIKIRAITPINIKGMGTMPIRRKIILKLANTGRVVFLAFVLARG